MYYYNYNKNILTRFTTASVFLPLLFFVFLQPAQAATPTVSSVCSRQLDVSETPDIFQTICPFVAFLNVFFISASVVFAIVVMTAFIKMAFAQGDPKALNLGKTTLWNAFLAFLGFIFIGTFLVILNNTFGLGIRILEEPIGPFNYLLSELHNFLCGTTILSGEVCSGGAAGPR